MLHINIKNEFIELSIYVPANCANLVIQVKDRTFFTIPSHILSNFILFFIIKRHSETCFMKSSYLNANSIKIFNTLSLISNINVRQYNVETPAKYHWACTYAGMLARFDKQVNIIQFLLTIRKP